MGSTTLRCGCPSWNPVHDSGSPAVYIWATASTSVNPSRSLGCMLLIHRWSAAGTHCLASDVSADDGPTSMKACRPRRSTARMPASKFTGAPMCRTQ